MQCEKNALPKRKLGLWSRNEATEKKSLKEKLSRPNIILGREIDSMMILLSFYLMVYEQYEHHGKFVFRVLHWGI